MTLRKPSRYKAPRVAVVTHARKEDLFLQIWTAHYSRHFGAENLHLLKDGDDWSSPSEAKFGKISIVNFQGARQDRDEQMAAVLTDYCNALLTDYDFVLRCDCDEIIVPDPATGDWDSVFEECREHGYIYTLGLDIIQHLDKEAPIDIQRPILSQRLHASVAGGYCKPNLICAPVEWTSACHEIKDKPVRLSRSLLLFHLASMDRTYLERRLAERGDLTDKSYSGHAKRRLKQFEILLEFKVHPLDDARGELVTKITLDDAGIPKQSPRISKIFGRRWAAIKLPERFCGLIAPLPQ